MDCCSCLKSGRDWKKVYPKSGWAAFVPGAGPVILRHISRKRKPNWQNMRNTAHLCARACRQHEWPSRAVRSSEGCQSRFIFTEPVAGWPSTIHLQPATAIAVPTAKRVFSSLLAANAHSESRALLQHHQSSQPIISHGYPGSRYRQDKQPAEPAQV